MAVAPFSDSSLARLYNGFWSQSGLRMAGFSDQALQLPPGAVTYHDIFEAKYVTEYLEQYVDSHIYQSTSLRARISFGFSVIGMQKHDGVWHVESRGGQSIRARKIVVATGHTSRPMMPTLPGKGEFSGPIIHQRDFGKASNEIFDSTSISNVTVLGGGKSAADMVYNAVKAGKKVAWIIRQDGEGPAAFSAAAGKGPYKNGPEIAATRMMSTLSPSCFSEPSWLSSLVHGTARGRRILAQIWLGADEACRKTADFEKRKDARSGFAGLQSSTAIFWCTGPIGMIQHEDFWDTIAKNVSVFRHNILHLRERCIVLDDESEVPADALFCGTGWNPEYPFLSKGQTVDLGLPHANEDDPPDVARKWESLLKAADDEVIARFPQLADPPPFYKRRQNSTATRLYNCVAPLSDDSILFLGNVYLSNAFRTAEAQAIWATAYFDGNVVLPTREKSERDIAYMAAFSKRRYPSHGATGNYFHMDLVGYSDRLLQDVGLVSHRRQWWWQDFFYPCLASDFSHIKDEYLAKFGQHY
ncbi:MAG: hypothetical protein Q9228_005323 [Teloschistes exilis]